MLLLILRALLWWSLVSLHLTAGALLVRRYFPSESPWLSYIAPALTLVLFCNWVEHIVALNFLALLLPFTTLGALWLLFQPNSWEGLRLPTGVFLAVFAYAFFIRCLHPDILPSSDGLADLTIQAEFYQGEVLPATDMWLPPFKLDHYYSFQHYAAALMGRFLGVLPGVGSNLGHAVLLGLTGMIVSGIGWHLSEGKLWIAWLMPLLFIAAATGSSGYIWMTVKDPSPWLQDNISDGLKHLRDNPLWEFMAWTMNKPDSPERLELQVPGFWLYRDEFHPNAGGHLFSLISVFVALELNRAARTNLPWILALIIPFCVIITSIWALPLTGLICGSALILAWIQGYRPENLKLCLAAGIVGVVLALPLLNSVLSSPQSPVIHWDTPYWKPEYNTPWVEGVAQWWPVGLLWISLIFFWRSLTWPVVSIFAIVPFMLFGIEWVTIEDGRYNIIEKMWGSVYGVGLFTFLPVLALRTLTIYRLILSAILLNSLLSLAGWIHTTSQWIDFPHDSFHLEANGYLTKDPQKNRILQILSQFHGKTIFTGLPLYAYNSSPAAATLTQNRAYVAWTTSEERYGHEQESNYRAQEMLDFYGGKIDHPVAFLRDRHIAAVLIWPDDAISDEDLDLIKTSLEPSYDYIDCRQSGDKNAGVFLDRGGAF